MRRKSQMLSGSTSLTQRVTLSSKRTSAPPPIAPPAVTRQRPMTTSPAISVSASTNTKVSPVAAFAPALRTAAICRSATPTTRAPAAEARSAVRSVEASSTTMISCSTVAAVAAAAIAPTVAAMSLSSLCAGTMKESIGSASPWPQDPPILGRPIRPDGFGRSMPFVWPHERGRAARRSTNTSRKRIDAVAAQAASSAHPGFGEATMADAAAETKKRVQKAIQDTVKPLADGAFARVTKAVPALATALKKKLAATRDLLADQIVKGKKLEDAAKAAAAQGDKTEKTAHREWDAMMTLFETQTAGLTGQLKELRTNQKEAEAAVKARDAAALKRTQESLSLIPLQQTALQGKLLQKRIDDYLSKFDIKTLSDEFNAEMAKDRSTTVLDYDKHAQALEQEAKKIMDAVAKLKIDPPDAVKATAKLGFKANFITKVEGALKLDEAKIPKALEDIGKAAGVKGTGKEFLDKLKKEKLYP